MKELKPIKRSSRYLIVGALCVLAGALFLLQTRGHIPSVSALWPVAPLLGGIFILYQSFVKQGSNKYSFVGMVCLLLGIFFLLTNTVLTDASLRKWWPIFMTILGIALLPLGYRLKGHSRSAVLVPGYAITILSVFFLIFSLDLTDRSLLDFVSKWWPFLFIIIGGFFIISFFLQIRKK